MRLANILSTGNNNGKKTAHDSWNSLAKSGTYKLYFKTSQISKWILTNPVYIWSLHFYK
jgi:hypothetical protein